MTPLEKSKLFVVMFILCAATGLLWAGRMTGDHWVNTVTWVSAAYLLGQVGAVVASGWAVKTQLQTQKQIQELVQQLGAKQ